MKCGQCAVLIRTATVALAAFAGDVLSQDALPEAYWIYALQLTLGANYGSGFLLQASNSTYLVTARHVLYDTNFVLLGTNLTCRGFSRGPRTNPSPLELRFDLALLSTDSEVRFSRDHDVALVRFQEWLSPDRTVARALPGFTNLTPGSQVIFTASSNTKKYDKIEVASDVLLFGFPASIGLANEPQIDGTRPLLRKGVVAGFNHQRGTIIIDCPSYQGNSGGPVIARLQVYTSQINFSIQFPIIGILTAWIPFQDVWENVRFHYYTQSWANSGYSVVEPIDAALDLVWK